MVRWRMNDCLATTPSSRAFPSINRGRHRKRKIKHVKPASTPGASGTELARTRPDSWPRRVAAHHWPAASWLGRSCCRSFFACACPCGPAGGRLPALCGYALVLLTEFQALLSIETTAWGEKRRISSESRPTLWNGRRPAATKITSVKPMSVRAASPSMRHSCVFASPARPHERRPEPPGQSESLPAPW